jgi:hypothetical protein
MRLLRRCAPRNDKTEKTPHNDNIVISIVQVFSEMHSCHHFYSLVLIVFLFSFALILSLRD